MKMSNKVQQGPKVLRDLIDVGNTLAGNTISGGTDESLYAGIVVGTESARKDLNFAKNVGDLDNSIKSQLNSMGIANPSGATISAARSVMAASKDPAAYFRQVGTESFSEAQSGWAEPGYSGSFSGADYGSESIVGTEYYSDKDLDKNLGVSFALNVNVLETQSEFAETLYPSITVDPTDAGISIRTKITTVYRGIRHALLAKDSVAADRRNLLDGLTDPDILSDQNIDLIPYRMETDEAENAAEFVDKTVVAPTMETVGNVTYPTSFLAFKRGERRLLGLAAHPGIAAEGYDESDEIAPGAGLASILVSVRAKAQTADQGSLVVLNVLNMQYATYQRPAEGDGRDLILTFHSNRFHLDGSTKDREGAAIDAVEAFGTQGLYIKYSISFTFRLNTVSALEHGDVATVSIAGLYDASGKQVDHTTGSYKTLMDGLTIEALGYKYKMTRTNENRRSQGTLLDPIWQQENHKMRLGSPFTTKSPIGIEIDDSSRLDDLTTAIHVRNEALAVTQTLNYTEQLEQLMPSIVDEFEVVSLQGAGRHHIRPWFERGEINVKNLVQSLETKDALINARSAVLNRVADQVTRAVQVSRYMPALRVHMADPKATPTVTIACDEVTAAMLLIGGAGESRLLNDRYPYKVVTTNNKRWRPFDPVLKDYRRRLQWFLTVPSEDNQYNVLNWGNHFWSPILVTNTNLTRRGGTSNELTAQPRNLHVCHCPITGVFDILGISDLVANKLLIGMEGDIVTVVPPVVSGP